MGSGKGISVGVNVEPVSKAGVVFHVKLDQWGTGGIRGWLKGLETWHALGSVILKLWEGKVGEMEPRYCPPKPHFLFSPPSILSHWSLARGTRTPEIEGLVLNH